MATMDREAVVTLADVAERAGVSKATASKALADRYGVSAATRDRVRQAALDLDFTPNLLARGLGGGRTQTIGMITTDLDGRFAPQIMVGIEDTLGADKSSVIMCNSRGRAELEDHHIRELLRRSVDGLVVVGDYPEERPAIRIDVPVPVVYAFAYSAGSGDTSIVCDNVEAGRMATRHLIEGGKRRLAHIGGPQGEQAARDRLTGCRQELEAAGLDPAAVVHESWTEQWGWDATARLLDDKVAIDGLVCGNDQIARGALDQILARGLRTPDDVAVIGFDNWLPISQYSRHPFSSVDMNLHEVGHAAAQALLTPGGPQPGIQRIAGRIAVRSTTRP
jgi:LacI family transcriptional regulator